MPTILLLSLVALIAYSYVGYPCLLLLLGAIRRKTLLTAVSEEPSISVIIAAFNEERGIAAKLDMMLELDYPTAKREILVASDCSTDDTHAIVERYADRGVKLIVLPGRGGKTAAQNLAVSQARGEILVFTDATTVLAPSALRKLIEPFADPQVGCAGAQLQYQSKAGTAIGRGGGLYWRYEKWVKELESRTNSLIGVSGCLYAVRRRLYTAMPSDLISDFVIALDTFEAGYITTYARDAIAYELTNEAAKHEFGMRVRVIVRSIHALVKRARMLNPLKTGFFAVQLLSHKVLRYLVPQMLIAILGLTAYLAASSSTDGATYKAFLGLQLIVYAAVPMAYAACRRLKLPTAALSAPFYFLHANMAALWAFVSYVRGTRAVTWTTVR